MFLYIFLYFNLTMLNAQTASFTAESNTYLENGYFENITKNLNRWNLLLKNNVLSIEDLKNNNKFIVEVNEFKLFLNSLLKELAVVDSSIKYNLTYNTKVPKLLKSYYDFYNANKDYLNFISSISNISFSEEFKLQEYYFNILTYLLKGQNLLDFDDYTNNLKIEDRVSKFMLACKQILVNDNNIYYDYKIDEFMDLFLNDRKHNYYSMIDINRYAINLKRDFNSNKNKKDPEYKKILEYILYSELYNAISSLLVILKTSKQYNTSYYNNLDNKTYKEKVVLPHVLNYRSNKIDFILLNEIIDKALENFNSYAEKSIYYKFKNTGIDPFIISYNDTIDKVNNYCTETRKVARINQEVFACYKAPDILNKNNLDEDKFTYYDYYRNQLEHKYANQLNANVKTQNDCQSLLDLKYKEDKILYNNSKELINYLLINEQVKNPVFLLSSFIEHNNNPAKYFLGNDDLINTKCFKGDGILFDKITSEIFLKINNEYFNTITKELKKILEELEVLYTEPSFSRNNSVVYEDIDYLNLIEARLKSSPALIINIIENSINFKKKNNINNLELEKTLCSVVREINRKDELKKKAEEFYKILIVSSFLLSRLNLASNTLLLLNSVTILSSIMLTRSKVINFIEFQKLQEDIKLFLFTNHINEFPYLINSLKNIQNVADDEMKEMIQELIFTSILMFQSVRQFKAAYNSYKTVFKTLKNNPKFNLETRYHKPNISHISSNKNWYYLKDWFKQVWNCKGNNFTDVLLKVALPSAVVGNVLGVVPYVLRMPDDLHFDWTEVGIDLLTGTFISTARNLLGLRGIGGSNKFLDYGSRYVLIAGWGLLKVGINNVYYYKFENDRADIDRYIVARAFGETMYSGIISPLSSLTILKLLKGLACLYPGGLSGKVLKYGLMVGTSYLMGDIFHAVRFDSIDDIYSQEEGYLFLSKEKVDSFIYILENYSTLKIEEKELLLKEFDNSIWGYDLNFENDFYQNYIFIDDLNLEVSFFKK